MLQCCYHHSSPASVEVTHGGRTHRAIHTCDDSLAHSSAEDSLLQQPGALSTQRPGIRWKPHTNMGKMPSKWWEATNDSVGYLTQRFPTECWLLCSDTRYGNSFPSIQEKQRLSGVHGSKAAQDSPVNYQDATMLPAAALSLHTFQGLTIIY